MCHCLFCCVCLCIADSVLWRTSLCGRCWRTCSSYTTPGSESATVWAVAGPTFTWASKARTTPRRPRPRTSTHSRTPIWFELLALILCLPGHSITHSPTICVQGWVNDVRIQEHGFPPSPCGRVVVCGLPGVYEKICGPRTSQALSVDSALYRLGYSDDMVIKLWTIAIEWKCYKTWILV